ncbi:MAG: branched-chain amino acid ABC transporter permease [Armatimonadota bacterium]|nr:branched-chain amino acid ABC transporter permease [Armatimonadota bacterium]MDR7518146.1 branched-chain amino acid ABC transporter permease [Armatimonadota bacterium]
MAPWAALGAAAVVLAWAPSYYVHLAVLALIFALLAMSLNLLMGYAGLTSFGHAAYFGSAAYAAAVISLRYGGSFGQAALGALAVAGGLAALFGALATWSRGVYFLLITMALGQVTWGLAYRWVSVTGGDNGLPGVMRPPLVIGWPLADVRGYYLFTLLVTAVAFALLVRITDSPFGYALRGIREGEARMRTLGYPVWGYKYAAFVISGVFAGVAGVLHVFYNGFVGPQDLHVSISAQTVLMVILGGSGTVGGPVLGAGVLVLLQNLLSTFTRRWMAVLGIIYILVVLYAPEGIVGVLRRRSRIAVPPLPPGR